MTEFERPMRPSLQPPEGTVERWAWDYVTSESLAHKLAPPEPPAEWESAPISRDPRPGRPPELTPVDRRVRTPKPGALRDPKRRAQLLHTFFHHELQAAELMAWALLRFVHTPREFRRGLVRIATDEIRHMRLYAEHLERLGHPVGSFGVRDWFWQRVGAVKSEVEFVAMLGVGFEGANLDHAARFALALEEAGDAEAAAIQRTVGVEEIPHVRFAVQWFERWAGPLDERWREVLPPPLSPLVMRGRPLDREARRKAGMSDAFLDALEAV